MLQWIYLSIIHLTFMTYTNFRVWNKSILSDYYHIDFTFYFLNSVCRYLEVISIIFFYLKTGGTYYRIGFRDQLIVYSWYSLWVWWVVQRTSSSQWYSLWEWVTLRTPPFLYFISLAWFMLFGRIVFLSLLQIVFKIANFKFL